MLMTRDGPLLGVLLAIGLGASIGAIIRWVIGVEFNSERYGWFPWGTFVVNIIAGFLIGFVLSWLSTTSNLSPLVRLFLVTGFLGGLSTFSSFCAEDVAMLFQGYYWRAFIHVTSHVVISLVLTALGFFVGHWVFKH